MANSLMFEVGIKKASDQYDKIYKEVMELAKVGDKPINIELAIKETQQLQNFMKTLQEFGSGKQLEPLIDKVAKLQERLSETANSGMYLDRLRGEVKALTVQFEAAERNLESFKKTGVANPSKFESLKNGVSEARANLDRVTAQLASAEARLSNGQSEALQRLKTDADNAKNSLGSLGANVKVDASGVEVLDSKLQKVIEDIGIVVNQAKKLAEGIFPKNGVGDEQAAGAKSLAETFEKLASAKVTVTAEEKNLSSETRSATTNLELEAEQAKKVVTAMNEASNAITAAALAAKNLYTILGGNSSDVAKFMELASKMDALSRKSQFILQGSEKDYRGGKIAAFGEVKEEMAAVQRQMDELKKSANVGSPLLDAFADAVKKMGDSLKTAGVSFSTASDKFDKLNKEMANPVPSKTGTDFKTWAQEVQALVAQVKELVAQMEKLHQVQNKNVSSTNVASTIQQATDVERLKEKIRALNKEIDELEKGPLKRYLEIQDKIRMLTGNWRDRPDALGLGDTKKQKHDILDLAIALDKFVQKKGEYLRFGGPYASGGGYMVSEKDAVAALAKEYKLTNEEAAKYIKLITESELVSRRYQATLAEGQLKIYQRGGTPAIPQVTPTEARQRYYTQLETEEWKKVGEQMTQRNRLAKERDELIHKTVTSTQQLAQSEQKIVQIQQQAATAHQGGLFDTQKFTTLQEVIDKIIVEINRLKEAFAGIGSLEGLTSFKTSINGVMVEVNNLVEAITKINGALHIDKSAEEITEFENKIAALKVQYEQLQAAMTSTAKSATQMNSEFKTIGESKGSEVTLNKNVDKLQAALKSVENSISVVKPKFDAFKEAGLSEPELERKYNLLVKIKEAITQAMNNKELMAKPGAISSIKIVGEDIMALGEVTKELRSLKGAEKLAADFERLAANAEIAKRSMQGLPSTDVKNIDNGAVEKYVEHNKDILRKWREYVRDIMKVLHQDIKEGFTGMDKSNLWDMYRNLRQQFGAINNKVTGETLKDPKELLNVMMQYKSLIMEINAARIQQSGAKQQWAEGNEYRMREAAVAYAYLEERMNRFDEARRKMIAGGQDTSSLDAIIQKAREFLFVFDKMQKNGFYGDLRLGDILKSAEFRTIAPNGRTEIRDLMEQQRANISATKESEKASKYAERENQKWADSMDNAKIKANQLKSAINELSSKRFTAKQLGLDTSDFSAEIDKLKVNLAKLQAMMGGAKIYGTTQDFVKSPEYVNPLANAKGISRDIVNNEQVVRNTADSLSKVEQKLVDVNGKLENYNSLIATAGKVGIDTSGLEASKQKIIDLKNLLEQIKDNKGLTNAGDTFAQVMRGFGAEIKKADKEYSNLQKTFSKTTKGFSGDPYKDVQKEITRTIKLIGKLKETEDREKSVSINDTSIKNAISQLETYLSLLKTIKDAGGQLANGQMVYGLRGDLFDVAKEANARGMFAFQNEKASHSVNNLTDSERKLAQALGQSTNEMKNQSMVLSDLKMMAYQYLSVWGAQSFMSNIIQTGGQLEQQRLSLSAILGDMEKANTLFGQVKELALKSPFGVVQIDQMTKQLAAYSFEYKDLFDWTKRLADISAATGTSVDRLALALGHVRSEGALSGYTLRQFAMANVPVLRMLSENLGISNKEVRERVRKKEISADDVQEILKQLTDEGGMFYNAQEVMSQALNAKFKNLHDAFDIMYGEIAESGVGDVLKELANVLTQGAKDWERYAKDILAVAAAYGVVRTAIMVYNTALGANNISALRSIEIAQRRENANLRLAKAAGIITKAEYQQIIYNERYSVSGLKVAIVENKLTIEELQRAVALGKVNKAVAEAAVVQAGYDAVLIGSVQKMTLLRKTAFLIGEAFRSAAVAVKGFLSTAWPLLAITAIFDLINRTSQNNEAATEAANGAAKATNKYQDLQAMTERLGNSQGKSNEQLENNIKAMRDALVAVGAYTDAIKKQEESVSTLAEKYDVLYAAMKKTSDDAGDKQERKKRLIEEALSTGGGSAWLPWNWFRDNALRDAKDIDDYAKELYLAFDKNDRLLRNGMKRILKTRKEWKKEYESMSSRDLFMSFKDKEQSDILYYLRWDAKSSEAERKAGREIAHALYGSTEGEYNDYLGYSYKGAFDELRGHKEQLSKLFADAFNVDYPDIDLSKADNNQKIIFAKWLDKTINNLEDVKDSGKKALNDIIIEGTIKVRPFYTLDNENFQTFIDDFKKNNPLAYYEWNKHESVGALTEEEKRKSAESYGKTFSGITDSTLGNTSKKQIKELDAEKARLIKEQNSTAYREDLSVKKRVDDRIAEINLQKRRLKQAQKDFNQYGDPDKGNKEDKEAKKLRERVRILKEAADSYQYWRNRVGEKSASVHMKDEFGQLLKEQNLTIKNADELKKKLKDLRAEYSKKPQTKAMIEAIKEIDKEIAQLDRKDFEKETEEFLSRLNIEVDSLTRSWKTFNSVRDVTGNVNLAKMLSGADYKIGIAENLADALKEKIQKELSSVGVINFPLNVELSDKDIEKSVYDAFYSSKSRPTKQKNESEDDYKKRLADYEERIKAIVEVTKKWRDLEREATDNAITSYTKLISDAESLKQKIALINNEYAKEIENLKKMLNLGLIDKEQYDKGVSKADTNRKVDMVTSLANNVDWGAQSQFFGHIFSQAGDEFMKRLNSFIGSDEYKNMDVTQQKKYLDVRDNVNKSSDKWSLTSWNKLSQVTRDVQNAFIDLMSKTFELEDAQKQEKDAIVAAMNARGTSDEVRTHKQMIDATSRRLAAEEAVTESQKNLKDKENERQQTEADVIRGMNGLNNAVKNITSGSLSDLALGIGQTIQMFGGSGSIAKNLAELFGASGNGYGQIIAAVLSLLDVLKDKSAETIKELLDNVFDAVIGIIQDLMNGKLFEAILESTIEGIGRIVEEVVKQLPNNIFGGLLSGDGMIVGALTGVVKGVGAGIGNAIEGLFGFDANNSNEREVREAIAQLDKDIVQLNSVIEYATKELKESSGGQKSINAAKEAKDAINQVQNKTLEKWREGMGYHSAHHSNAYNWDLEDSTQDSVNAALRDYSQRTGKALKQINVDNWEEFMTLTPEEMDYIRDHANDAWKDITTEGSYEWVHEFLNEYADLAGKVEEINEELKEKLTMTTLSGLHDQFLNELMDMEKSAKDFTKDFQKMLMKAVLNANLSNLLDKDLEKWRSRMAEMMEASGGNLTDANIAELQSMWDDIVEKGLKMRDTISLATGYTGDKDDSGLSSTIKGVTEQTADLLASYINAIRLDVSVNRGMIAQYYPQFLQAMTQGNTIANSQLIQLQQIAANTLRNADFAKDIYEILHASQTGTRSLSVKSK